MMNFALLLMIVSFGVFVLIPYTLSKCGLLLKNEFFTPNWNPTRDTFVIDEEVQSPLGVVKHDLSEKTEN